MAFKLIQFKTPLMLLVHGHVDIDFQDGVTNDLDLYQLIAIGWYDNTIMMPLAMVLIRMMIMME